MADSGPTRNPDRLNLALKHLQMGFAGFSVWSTLSDGTCKCPKGAECVSPGKHPIPPKGFLAATTDPATLTTMMSAASEPNYGIVWPEGGRVVILDVDGKDWKHRIDILISLYGPLPKTKTTRTPSGGLHLFYVWPMGVPLPEGNTLHGFVIRYPWKGYVVGPGSAINGKVYLDVGADEIAFLPVEWVEVPEKPPLITVTDAPAGYEMPESVETGHRHDEIVKLAASLWNKRIDRTMGWPVVVELSKRFVDQMDDPRLKHEWYEAYDTAEKKWVNPEGGERGENASEEAAHQTTGREVIEVGLLEAPVGVAPISMRSEAFSTSSQIAELLDHWTPRTDAGYEALLITTLVYAGALMGHTPVCFYGSREQHTNIMAMLVGSTGSSRKGTTVSLVHGAFRQVTDAVNGLKNSANSGEGLIALAAKRDGEPILLVEEEFDRFLAAKGRDGSTLSSILRQAFDDIPLSSATSQRVVRADTHHIALLANTTVEEIGEKFARVDLKNGFANRIAWTGTFGRPGALVTVHDNALSVSLRDDLRDVLAFTSKLPMPLIGGVTHQFTDPARDLLAAASARYAQGVGLAPFLSRRLDTIAARIALIYSCFDHARLIDVIHVEASLAVTDYVYASALWVFPETTGDARADLVLRHLKVAGFLNGQEIEALVGKRTLDKQQVADILGLMGYARIAERPRKDGKAGRPQRGLELT